MKYIYALHKQIEVLLDLVAVVITDQRSRSIYSFFIILTHNPEVDFAIKKS